MHVCMHTASIMAAIVRRLTQIMIRLDTGQTVN